MKQLSSGALILSFVYAFCLFSSLVASAQIGAVYFLNNNATANEVVVYRVEADGSLAYSHNVPTGGRGSGATANVDPLGSQGAVTTLRNNLFVLNANSSTLTYFMIDSMNASSLKLVASADTYGQFPVSVTAYGSKVCVLTGGIGNGIRCWTFDSSMGLTALSWDRNTTSYSNITSNPPGPLALSQIGFTPNGDAIVVTIRNVGGQGQVLVYPISGNSLAATPFRITPTGAITTFGFSFVGKSNVLVASDPHGSSKPGGVNVVAFTPSTGDTTVSRFQSYVAANATTTAPCWTGYSPLANAVFVVDAATFLISQISIDATSRDASLTGYVNVTKSAFDISYLMLNSTTEVWYALTPTGTPSVTAYYVGTNGAQQTIYNYPAPTSANVGSFAQGIAAYMQSSASHLVPSTLLIALMALYKLFV